MEEKNEQEEKVENIKSDKKEEKEYIVQPIEEGNIKDPNEKY